MSLYIPESDAFQNFVKPDGFPRMPCHVASLGELQICVGRIFVAVRAAAGKQAVFLTVGAIERSIFFRNGGMGTFDSVERQSFENLIHAFFIHSLEVSRRMCDHDNSAGVMDGINDFTAFQQTDRLVTVVFGHCLPAEFTVFLSVFDVMLCNQVIPLDFIADMRHALFCESPFRTVETQEFLAVCTSVVVPALLQKTAERIAPFPLKFMISVEYLLQFRRGNAGKPEAYKVETADRTFDSHFRTCKEADSRELFRGLQDFLKRIEVMVIGDGERAQVQFFRPRKIILRRGACVVAPERMQMKIVCGIFFFHYFKTPVFGLFRTISAMQMISIWKARFFIRILTLSPKRCRVSRNSKKGGLMENQLFTPFRIGGLTVRNRFVRSATHEGLADEEGFYTKALSDVLAFLAQHEVGLIISGHAFVSPEGRASKFQASAASDDAIPHWRKTVDRIHCLGAKIALQLAHAGGNTSAKGMVGPSAFAQAPGKPECRELTVGEIEKLQSSFAAAAVRGKEAGFDAVQIHAAHGYLLSQFLSPCYNRRTDFYGGSLANRARMLYEVYDAVRNAVGRDFPVLVKINSADFAEGGFSPEECIEVCRRLEKRGLNAVELSGGIPLAGPKLSPIRLEDVPNGGKVYYEDTARRLKAVLQIPVILVGGTRDPEKARSLIEDGACDMISLSRPLIREPGLLCRWLAGDRSRAACVSCNACFRPIITGRGFYCPRDGK